MTKISKFEKLVYHHNVLIGHFVCIKPHEIFAFLWHKVVMQSAEREKERANLVFGLTRS